MPVTVLARKILVVTRNRRLALVTDVCIELLVALPTEGVVVVKDVTLTTEADFAMVADEFTTRPIQFDGFYEITCQKNSVTWRTRRRCSSPAMQAHVNFARLDLGGIAPLSRVRLVRDEDVCLRNEQPVVLKLSMLLEEVLVILQQAVTGSVTTLSLENIACFLHRSFVPIVRDARSSVPSRRHARLISIFIDLSPYPVVKPTERK